MKNISTLCCLLLSFGLSAQNILTLEAAKAITLEQNFGIQIAKNNRKIAENNTDRSVNGYLPTLNFNAGPNANFGGSDQSFSNGLEASTANAFTWGASAALQSNFVLYDKRRDLTLEQLRESVDLSDLQLRQNIQNTLFQVYSSYFQFAQLLENVEVLETAIEISRERLRRAQYALDFGQGTGLAVLNAEVDIQRDSINLLNAQQQIQLAERNLNVLMGRSSSASFRVDTTLVFEQNLQREALLERAKKENIDVRISQQNLTVNNLSLDIIEAEKRPTLNTGASYNYNFSDNPEGAFINTSNSRGLGANITLNWNLYDPTRKIRTQNTQLNLMNQKVQQNQVLQGLERDVLNAWDAYQNALFIMQVERAALLTNQENFERTREQTRIGRLTSIEFRQAQLNLINAEVNLNNAKYTAKLRELELKRLTSSL